MCEEMNFSRLAVLSWGMFHCGETWGAKTKRPESKVANCRKNGRRNDIGLPSKDIYSCIWALAEEFSVHNLCICLCTLLIFVLCLPSRFLHRHETNMNWQASSQVLNPRHQHPPQCWEFLTDLRPVTCLETAANVEM